ncbi:hypothetical protein BKA93DRAFT_751965 [Sparassis latifolia]
MPDPEDVVPTAPHPLEERVAQPRQSNEAVAESFTEDPGHLVGLPQERPLNVTDALSYLDSVKMQFQERPDVYNHFLDIMKDFKGQLIDTPGVIERVSNLFHGHPALIQGFNTFLPAGYRIECTTDTQNPNFITVTTPAGTTTQATDGTFMFGDSATTVVASSVRSPSATPVPSVNLEPALSYVQRVKARYLGEPERYKKFLEVLSDKSGMPDDVRDPNRESWSVAILSARCAQGDVVARVGRLFYDAPDLMKDFVEFLPDKHMQEIELARLAEEERRVATPVSEAKVPAKRNAESTSSTVPQKRKRKPVEKEKEREKDKDKESIAIAKTSSSKAKKGRSQVEPSSPRHAVIPPSPRRSHVHSHHLAPPVPIPPPAPEPSAPLTPTDSAHFFDRVKRALDSRETYNEFLKLVNLFAQDIIDIPRLVHQSRSYLGDGELMAQFREILGYDEQQERYAAGADVYSWPMTSLDRPSRNQLNLRYGSYRKLPDSEINVKCAGRDEMCRSVLNDEWVSQPTFASEDSGFLAHKKNVYEEALHRSEEERHEYDFHIEAIHRTIQMLEPLNNKIAQLSPDERNSFKLKPNFGGAGKAIHQRVVKKIYGKELGVEVYQAMQDVPALAIPVVLTRLKQKHEEWKRAQREWNKVWREVDARNYHKSLDHQGITFKAADKKAITARALVNQIEVARDEQMAKRASLIDPLFARLRPHHQLEFVVDDISVLQDAVKLTLTFLDRTQGQIAFGDRKKIETFLRAFIPLFFVLDPVLFNGSLVPHQEAATDSDMDLESTADDAEFAGSSSGSRSGRNSRKPAGGSSGDLRKKLLKSEQAKSSRRTRAQDAASPSVSRRTSPAMSETMQVEGDDAQSTTPANRREDSLQIDPPPARRRGRYMFYTNTTFYVVLRLLEILYSRLHLFKTIAKEIADSSTITTRPNPVMVQLGILNDIGKLGDKRQEAVHYYDFMLESCEKLFDNELELHVFEDQMRYMFGTKHSYKIITVDKLVGAIIKQVQLVLSDIKSQELFDLLRRERDITSPTTQDLLNCRHNTEKVLGPDENLFRIDWIPESKTVTMQLLGKDDSSFDDAEVLTGRWQAYVDSFISPEPTAGVPTVSAPRRSFLRRSKLPPAPEDARPYIVARGGLGIKVCVRTYRLFFDARSEDILFRFPSTQESEASRAKLEAATVRRKKWLEKLAAVPKADDSTTVTGAAATQPPVVNGIAGGPS